MFELQIVKHADLMPNDLDEIIRIKSAVWPYSYTQQIKWINDNLKSGDYHCILRSENFPVAYMNLIEMNFLLDTKLTVGIGIGNVCTVVRGKGYGKAIMKEVSNYLITTDQIGLLFCKEALIPFYEKCGWKLIDNSSVSSSSLNIPIYTMGFLLPNIFNKLIYSGRLF